MYHYDPSEIIQALENLIARHLLMPCRQAFFMQDSGKDSTGLYDRLKVLKPSNLNSQSSELTEKELNTVQVIPIVFQLGLRCSNLTSPKQRLEETPWMDHMFGATAAFLGFELDQDSSSQPHIPCYEALNKIMSHLVAANVKVKEETLRVLSSRFARSPSLTGDSSFWNCHAEIIALDPTIYLPDREATNDRQMGQPMVNLLTQIRSSAWSVSGLPQGSLAAKRHRTPYNIIKYDILLPIIQAFASTRVLPRLLDLWFNELQHPAIGSIIMRRDHLEQRDKHQSYVWEDFEVSKEIAPSLGASLSPSEFLQLLKDYSTEVTQNIVNAKADSDLRLCAALQVLTTLLLGVRELDSIIMDLPLLEEMITGCMKVLEQFNSKSYNCRWLVWRLLSTATRTWIHFRDGLKATLPDGLAELPIVLHERLYSVSTISMPWSMIQEATEALSCYGTILEEARERHFVIPWSNPPGQLLDMMRNILSSKDADIDDWARYCFVSVIIQRPSLLTPAYSETDEDSQAAAFKLQSDIVRLILNEARNKITSWRKEDQASNIPGARALHDCWQSLFDKILHMEALVPRRDPSVNLGKHSLVVKHLVEMESSAQSAGTQAKDDYLFLRQSYAKIPCVLFKNHDAEPIMKSTMNGLDRLWQNLNKDQVYTAVTSLLHVMSDLEFPGKIDIQEFVSLLSRHLDAQKGLEHFSATQWEQEHALVETLVHVLLKQHVLQGKTIIDPSKWAESATSSKAASLCILNYILHETQRPDTFEERGLYDKFCGRIESESPNEPVSYPIVIECLAGAGKLERDLIMYDRHGKDGTIEKQDRLQRAINPYLQEDEFRTYIEAYMFCKRSKAGINSKEAALQVVHIFSKDTNPVAFRVVDDEIFRVMGGSFPDKMSRNAIEKCCRYPGSRGCWRFFTMLFRHTTKMPSGSVENLYPFEGDWDIFITLCNFLSQTEDVEIFEMISQTLIQIVRHEKFRPTQLAFEALLTALQTLASPSAPSLPTTSARTIFSRICSLTRILLVRAPLRNRLRGRMHLLIPLLQSLLRCFFTQSNRTSSATKDRITLPRWLAAANPSVANADQPPTATISTISKPILKSQTTQNKLLTAKQATHYAQLLTTLVDPSTSSVSTHKYNASAPLTDAVRAARTTTAHHIGPIIAELCACLMKGGTYSAPGVREALMPGIWATLEVMASVNVGGAAGGVVRGRRGDQRGLGMVEVLGASFGDEKGGETEDAEGMRSLLKGLIGEWRRVGGGK
ncbi:MAG: hypothetical protein M1831_002323 [Alyxoria varia]|nr:MAG: hypothetical protein M1831_002323 [Alyxoria varia]